MISRTLKLVEAIEAGGETIESVTVRTPKGGDYLKMENASKGKGEQFRSLFMIQRLCNLTAEATQELEEVDINRISERIEAIKNEQMQRAKELDEGKG